MDYINSISAKLPEGDVFKCEHGVKQIQNLHKYFCDIEFVGRRIKTGLGWKHAKVLNMQFFIKHPGYKITAPHQDAAYFDKAQNIVTCWIPLMDVNESNSCMLYVPNSHKYGLYKHEATGTNVRTRTGKTGVSQYSKSFKYDEFEAIPMKAYEILVHDQYAMHYSSINHSDKPRIALTMILQLS